MTVCRDGAHTHAPPASSSWRLTMPAPACSTSKLPALSNCIDRGFVRPLATTEKWYPGAATGLIPFVGAGLTPQVCPVARRIRIVERNIVPAKRNSKHMLSSKDCNSSGKVGNLGESKAECRKCFLGPGERLSESFDYVSCGSRECTVISPFHSSSYSKVSVSAYGSGTAGSSLRTSCTGDLIPY